jgi:hypothetical protein
MNIHREIIRNIKENYFIWKRIVNADYKLLGLSDDIFTSQVRYYFSPAGFGIIMSEEAIIVSGNNKEKVKKEIIRLEKMRSEENDLR